MLAEQAIKKAIEDLKSKQIDEEDGDKKAKENSE